MIKRLAATVIAAALPLALFIPSAASATSPPIADIIGDSYTNGSGSDCDCQTQAWFNYTLNDLGWQLGNVVADPGAGYVTPGTYGTLAQALSAHPIPANSNYVFIQGGLNDSNADPASIPAAVANLLSIVHQQAPNAVPIVIGMVDPIPDHYYGAHQVAVARAIGDYNAIGPDTRYTIAFMATFEVNSSAVHPTSLGHHQLGDWVAWHLAHGLDNGTPLVWHPELGWWTT